MKFEFSDVPEKERTRERWRGRRLFREAIQSCPQDLPDLFYDKYLGWVITE